MGRIKNIYPDFVAPNISAYCDIYGVFVPKSFFWTESRFCYHRFKDLTAFTILGPDQGGHRFKVGEEVHLLIPSTMMITPDLP